MANWNMPAGAGSYDERCSDWGDEEPEPEPAILRSIPLGPDPLVDATLALDADGYLTITSASGTAVLWQAEARALRDALDALLPLPTCWHCGSPTRRVRYSRAECAECSSSDGLVLG